MTRANPLQGAFNAGELTPRLHARVDFTKYPAGLEKAENLICLPEGGLSRRPGSRFVAPVKDSAKKSRLRRFEFSTDQAYCLEFAETAIRFFRFQGQIAAGNIGAAITNGTFGAGISGWSDQSNGTGSIAHDASAQDMELRGGGSGNEAIAEQSVTTTTTGVEHVVRFRVKAAAGDGITVRVGSSSGGSQYLSGVTARTGWHCLAFTPTASPFFLQFQNANSKTISLDDVSLIDAASIEIGSPYGEGDLFQVGGPQSADALYLFNNNFPPYVLTRRSNSEWSLTELDFQDGPWSDKNETPTTFTPSATSGQGVTITASSTNGINNGAGFLTTDIGRLIRLSNPASGTNWGWARIVGRSSSTVVTVDVGRAFATTSAKADWHLGAWSDTTGWPGVGAFFEQRLYTARSSEQPQSFWASETAGFTASRAIFSPDSPNASDAWDGTVEDDDALDFTLAAENVNTIEWLAPNDDTLVIGTAGGEWRPDSEGAVITPLDITARPQTAIGSAPIEPLRVNNVVLFVQRARRKIREFVYTFDLDGYQAFDMTRLAEHITRGGIVEMVYQQEPDSVVWAVRSDGQLLSMTYRREEDVVGWGRHIFGGGFNGGQAVVESVATVPGADGTAAGQIQDSTNREEVWVIVKRTINGQTVRYIEVLERPYEDGDAQEDAYYSDSLITYDDVETTAISGLTHLEGETVSIWADGAVQANKTVTSGQIALDAPASVVQVGLPYRHFAKLLKLPFGAPAGTGVGKIKRLHGVTAVLLNTHQINIGPDMLRLVPVDFRAVDDAMDTAVPLFTGERFAEIEGDWERDARLVVQGSEPAPFTLLALAPEMQTNDLR